ncbi:oocyte zinc finger protein XlCOF6-like [Cimex lectularius]|uniref:C2H2-type domain-containing protein n=1 Tax=Cimex lectularius TaxID=79782 RepID=A0A8I6RP02_CIMLE|nr:oocyte zinc finger protein XlCOF6-like [Cimex lectularius]XP_014247454.1 oocyte zinc finger protein XlCOF6-like [Cimex lectularius]
MDDNINGSEKLEERTCESTNCTVGDGNMVKTDTLNHDKYKILSTDDTQMEESVDCVKSEESEQILISKNTSAHIINDRNSDSRDSITEKNCMSLELTMKNNEDCTEDKSFLKTSVNQSSIKLKDDSNIKAESMEGTEESDLKSLDDGAEYNTKSSETSCKKGLNDEDKVIRAADGETNEEEDGVTDKKLNCFRCGVKYPNHSELYTHVRTHYGKKVYVCNYKCGDAMNVTEHLEMHTEIAIGASKNRKFVCMECGYVCQASHNMIVHMRCHTGRKPFKCSICEYSCKTRFCLKRHEQIHDRDNHRRSDEGLDQNMEAVKPYRCSLCSFSSSRKNSLKSHFLSHGLRDPTNIYGNKTPKRGKKKKRFACKECDYVCANESTLVIHIRTHTGEKPFACDLCSYRGSTIFILRRHRRIHTGERPFACDGCDYTCTDANSLKLHRRTHTGEKPFSCKLCDYKSARSTSLKIHMRTHTGEKPYGCTFCDYRSANRSGLRSHMMSHTGEKPFSCDVCDYKCSSSGSLKRHANIHLQEAPSTCAICGFVCPSYNSLRRHMKNHVTEKLPLVCPEFECEFTSFNLFDMKKHLKTHQNSGSLACHICGLVCQHASALSDHLQRVHSFPTEIIPRRMVLECDKCNFKTLSEGDLRTHIMHHISEKSFASILKPEIKLEVDP